MQESGGTASEIAGCRTRDHTHYETRVANIVQNLKVCHPRCVESK